MLDLAEMGVPEGVVGEVVAIGPAPRIAGGRGRVVLTTVNHLNNFVFHLTLQNADGVAETLGVTGYHKFYDQAQGWQSVVDLTVGDSLRGQDGQSLTVVDITRDPGVQRVYNLTVESDHVYFVGDLTTLTHNNCNAYSVGFSVEIPRPAMPTGQRAAHFKAANRILAEAMDADPAFAASMRTLVPDIGKIRGPRGGIWEGTFKDWTWNHKLDQPGVLELVPKSQHKPSAVEWMLFHRNPHNYGGHHQWGHLY